MNVSFVICFAYIHNSQIGLDLWLIYDCITCFWSMFAWLFCDYICLSNRPKLKKNVPIELAANTKPK